MTRARIRLRFFGLLYLRLRALWPLVIAHGLVDTVGLIALYAGMTPR